MPTSKHSEKIQLKVLEYLLGTDSSLYTSNDAILNRLQGAFLVEPITATKARVHLHPLKVVYWKW